MRNQCPRILHIGPGRLSRGGVNTVINRLEEMKDIKVKRLETFNGGPVSKKLLDGASSFLSAPFNILWSNIVHIHCSLRSSSFRKLPFFLLARFMRRPIVLHLHAPDFEDLTLNVADRLMIRRSEVVIVLSESWRARMQKLVPREYSVVLNPADPKIVSREKVSRFLYSGKLEHRKGFKELIIAFSNLHDSIGTLALAGDGEIQQAKELVSWLGAREKIQVLGWQDEKEVRRLYETSRFFVLPSRAEGLPMSLIDSIAAGCIPIVTYVGGVPDVCKSNNSIQISTVSVEAIEKALRFALEASKEIKENPMRDRISAQSVHFELMKVYSKILQ